MKKRKAAVITGALGVITAGIVEGNQLRKKYNRRGELVRKIAGYYEIFNKWLMIHQSGGSLVSYFTENTYKTIAIYGYKELGERLYDELKESDIKVDYIIDKAADNMYTEIDCVTPDDVLPDVDVVIVASCFYFDEIKELMSKKLECPIVSLADVVDWVSSN